MSAIVPLRRRRENIAQKIKRLAQDSGKVAFSPHALKRMRDRGLTRIQVLRCLQKGQQEGDAAEDGPDAWRIRLKHRTAGVQVNVVAVLKEDKCGGMVVVVTTFR